MGRPRKAPREKDLTQRFNSGELEEEHALDARQRFTDRSKNHQANKTAKTAAARDDARTDATIAAMPVGRVIQVHSLYLEVDDGQQIWLCTIRKTMNQVLGGDVIVGDMVRIKDGGSLDEIGRPQATIEELLPRKTILTRSESSRQKTAHPIVANANQMLIVAAARDPEVKWGLIDRVLIAAESGGLVPIICLNKFDLLDDESSQMHVETLAFYRGLGIATVATSVTTQQGLTELRTLLAGKMTVLAGHSGVGKSSLVRAVQPQLDLRVAVVSQYTGKGRHTTTSARIYQLDFGGSVIDTPGVKMFGLWQLTREKLDAHFTDVVAGNPPAWRKESYERIQESIAATEYGPT